MRSRLQQFGLLLVACAFSVQVAHGAATIVINNLNGAGVGFNDVTPVAPVGGNTGTTLGQQRLIAFQYAANIWGATLTSSVPIVVGAQFSALTCTATSAVLGSAGPTQIWRDFAAAPFAGTWYHYALANKLFGAELGTLGAAQINANFNVNLGAANCLAGSPFYLGLDNNHGTAIDLVAVLLHEFSHGLGFSTVTSSSTGVQNGGFPSVYDRFLFDHTANKLWVDMTNAERVASAIGGELVWSGAQVVAAVPGVLSGVAQMTISAPASLAGILPLGTASFGPPLVNLGLTGEIMPVTRQLVTGDACLAVTGSDALAVNGRIAIAYRGVCGFAVKAKNLQLAGAIGVIIINNVAGPIPPPLGGSDPTVTIPTVSVTLADGIALSNFLLFRSRTHSGLNINLGLSTTQLAYADSSFRPYMYTPNPLQTGSSVSHWDTRMNPNMLMEPSINADLTHSVVTPQDLTFQLLKDIGW